MPWYRVKWDELDKQYTKHYVLVTEENTPKGIRYFLGTPEPELEHKTLYLCPLQFEYFKYPLKESSKEIEQKRMQD